MAMASSGDRPSFWSRLRHRHRLESRAVDMDIWDLLDEFIEGSPARGSPRMDSSDMNSTIRDWLTRRNGVLHLRTPDLIDVSSVLKKCHKVVYKPNSTRWGKGKSEDDHNECPVCLETFVAKDQLLLLPCKHQFHSACITPWIQNKHACCPCCRADILGGTKRTSGMPNSNTRSINRNHSNWSLSMCLGTLYRRVRANRGQSLDQQSLDGRDAWEGLHEYITAALAEMDVELNRLLR